MNFHCPCKELLYHIVCNIGGVKSYAGPWAGEFDIQLFLTKEYSHILWKFHTNLYKDLWVILHISLKKKHKIDCISSFALSEMKIVYGGLPTCSRCWNCNLCPSPVSYRSRKFYLTSDVEWRTFNTNFRTTGPTECSIPDYTSFLQTDWRT